MAEIALFFSAFLAATLLPFSSEIAFVTALHSGMNTTTALIFASSGNVLAIMVNYGLGYWLREKTGEKITRSKSGMKALYLGERYGYWGLMLSWLPLIGDPLTLVAGMLRLNVMWFVVLAGSLRVLRYVMLTLAF